LHEKQGLEEPKQSEEHLASILNKSLINEHMGEARIPEEDFSSLLKKLRIE